jgi:hypothetical protein
MVVLMVGFDGSCRQGGQPHQPGPVGGLGPGTQNTISDKNIIYSGNFYM